MTAVLWAPEELVAATQGELLGDWGNAVVTGVEFDSRKAGTGDLFLALKGNRDGHDFAQGAADAGAIPVISDPSCLAEDATALLVDDVFLALNDLARAARARCSGEIIAVTGSVGKTSTKEALGAVFSRLGRTHLAQGSFNNHIGVPLTLARMPADTEFGIFEIGMNHAGEIRDLVPLVQPRVAIVTAIAPVHLEHFDGLEAIARAKAEIFEGLQPGGFAIINQDTPCFGLLTDHALGNGASNVIGFGETDLAAARLVKVSAKPSCSCASAEIAGQAMTFKVRVPGRHMVQNALAVLATVRLLDQDLGQAGIALAALTPADGRGTQSTVHLPSGSFTVIDESYNASPEAVRAALSVLAATDKGHRARRIAVLGDMKELGAGSVGHHASLAPDVIASGVDLVVTVGDHMKALWESLPQDIRGRHADTADVALADLLDHVAAGDVVMVKGSRSMGLERIVQALNSLDERSGKQVTG